ncbi:hypothetical protein TNCV_2603521 [Trichonephila clavipes]|nr:hypothetical protein TNCV_2603521 [Trichonephila clavipes]
MNINVALCSYSWAFGDGARNFKPRSRTRMIPKLAPLSPNFHTIPMGGRLSFDIFNVPRPPLHGIVTSSIVVNPHLSISVMVSPAGQGHVRRHRLSLHFYDPPAVE